MLWGWDGVCQNLVTQHRGFPHVEGLTSVIGRGDRAKPLRDCCVGLIVTGMRPHVCGDQRARVADRHPVSTLQAPGPATRPRPPIFTEARHPRRH